MITKSNIQSIISGAIDRVLNEEYKHGDVVEVLKTSQRGAKLVTDGEKVAWIQGRWIRPDGTLTSLGEKNLMDSDVTLEDWKAKQAEKDRWYNMTDEEREEERRKEKEAWIAAKKAEGDVEHTWEMPERELIDASPKAWKIQTNERQRLYGKFVPVYIYLPKSQTKIKSLGGGKIEVSLPDWCYRDKQRVIESLYGKSASPSAQPQPTKPANVPEPHRYEIYPASDDASYEERDYGKAFHKKFEGKPESVFMPSQCYAHGKLEEDLAEYEQISDLICMEPDAENELALGGNYSSLVKPGVYKCSFDGKPCTLYVWFADHLTTGICCYDDDEDAKEYIIEISKGRITGSMMESVSEKYISDRKIFEQSIGRLRNR